MRTLFFGISLFAIATSAFYLPAAAKPKHIVATGTVILGGGFTDTEATDLLIQTMVESAPEEKPNVVIIPTADARLEPAARSGNSISPIDYENDVRPDFISLGSGRVRVIHTRNKYIADSPNFSDALRFASLVWIPGGDPQLLFNIYPRTRVERELKAVLDRGATIAADSAGAMLLGQARFTLDPDHSEKAPVSEPAAALVPGVFVLPHANRFKSGVAEAASQAFVAAHPDLLGLLLDENTAVVIEGSVIVKVIGKGRVEIAESATSTRWLQPNEHYDLRRRAVVAAPQPAAGRQ